MLKNAIQNLVRQLILLLVPSAAIQKEDDDVAKILIAKHLVNDIKKKGILSDIKDSEFKVFSQFGDDGIIQYLIDNVKIRSEETRFVEFGVEDYTEANTRFLLVTRNWSGLVMEADKNYALSIKNRKDYWKYDLRAERAFVTKKNINSLFRKYRFDNNLGLLSLDVDGNDYWLWQSLEVVKPIIVVVEYNSVFGKKHEVTIPYKENFFRTKAHYSNLYWGASLGAFLSLAKQKGYVFLGTNSAGNNAYFVRRDRKAKLKEISLADGFTASKYRESRDRDGRLTFVSGEDRLTVLRDMPVFNLKTRRVEKIGKLYNLKKW